jgi:Putative metal-binding motif
MKTLLFLPVVLGALAACNASNPAAGSPDAACTTQKFYPDSDGDGFGDDAKAVEACDAPVGFIAKGGDCNDDDAAIHPGAAELCDGVDNNCDGLVDDADPTVEASATFYRDADGDGYGDPNSAQHACAAPAGFVTDATDCDDTASAVHPGATEVCDGIDNNCNGLIDDADPTVDLSTAQAYYRDNDHDSFGAGAATMACTPPAGFVAQNGDCNDNDAATHPGAVEVCDGADNDCDGGIDGTPAHPNQCAALVGSYTGSYTHQATEAIGTEVINQMTCSGTGSGSLVLGRTPALQGTFTCVYTGGLEIFSHDQSVAISASVALDGTVTGTVDHTYNALEGLHHVYSVTGTQTATHLTVTGMGSFFPDSMSAEPWAVTLSFATSR